MPRTKAASGENLPESSAVIAERPPEKILGKRSKDYVFRLVGKFRKSSHGSTIYPKHTIDNMDVIADPETGLPRTLRLLKGVRTLWMDEQDNIDEKLADRMRPSLVFHDGILRVPANDTLTAEFLLKKNCCLNNPNRPPGYRVRYYLVDAEGNEKSLYEAEMKRQQARSMALDAKPEDMVYHAKFLNILMVDPETGDELTEIGLRTKYIQYATEHPVKFMESFGAADLKYHYIVNRCVTVNKIIIDRGALMAKWDTGYPISTIPEQQDPVKFLARYAFTEEGRSFRERLDKIDIASL